MSKEVIAYVFGKRLSDMRDEDVKRLTGICISFGYCNPDCTIDTGHLRGLEAIAHFRQINPTIKILISLGGSTSGGWSAACLTKQGRDTLIESAMEFVRQWGLDGVDLDWEFPAFHLRGKDALPEDKFTYTMLCRGFRAKMDDYGKQDGKRYWLTMAMGADLYMLDCFQVERVGQILDYILIMTYDMRNQHSRIPGGEGVALSGHHSNLYPSKTDPYGVSVERSVEFFKAWGVPAEKIIIGCAHYAKMWTNVKRANNGLNQPGIGEAGAGGYGNLHETYLYEGSPYKEFWDEAACAPYLYNERDRIFITYDNPRSIACKVEYAKKEGLAGLMFWAYFNDETGALVDAYFKA